MKKNSLLTLTAIIALGAGGWYLYRRSKGLPFFPAGTTAPVATGSTTTTGSGTSLAGTISTVTSAANAAETLLSNLGTSLGIGGSDDDSDY